MADFLELLQLAQLVVYGGLAVVALVTWWRRREAAAAWLAATFGSLGSVIVVGQVVPEDLSGVADEIITRGSVVGLVLFPYFLYRFMRTFSRPRVSIFWAANGITALLVVWSLALHFPDPGEPQGSAFQAYLAVFLVQWVGLSGLVAVRLWRGGNGQPAVAKTRMRLLAVGALGMALALVLAATASAGDEVSTTDVVTQLLALASGPLFLLGFAPPGFIRTLWRQRSAAAVREAELALMRATRPSEITDVVLPQVSSLMGGRGAVFLDASGAVAARHGLAAEEAETLALAVRDSPRSASVLAVDMSQGCIAVEAGPFTPFFGREESEILTRFAVVTDLALTRVELLERERHLIDQLLDAQSIARIGSWEWEPATGRVIWSEELYRILGMDPSVEVSFDTALSLSHPDDREHGITEVERARETGEQFSFEQRAVLPHGDVKVMHVRGKWLADDGAPPKVVATVQDITDRKREEEAREQFIANAAHELRTPLTALLGFLQVIESKGGDLSPEQAQAAFAAANRSGDRLRILVDNLLDLTKLQQAATEVPEEDVDVRAVVADVLEMAPAPADRDVVVEGDAVARANRGRLEQILVNLITNAYRYGGRRIEVAVRTEGPTVRVDVTDDGPGVDAQLVPHLFEPFTRGPHSASVGGSGLGLTIAARLASAARGTLSYEQPPSGGARFVLVVPAAGR